MSSDQGTTIMTAHNQWAKRPAEDRCGSVAEWTQRASDQAEACREKLYSGRDLDVDVQTLTNGAQVPVMVSPNGRAQFNNWSFGQTSRLVGAPASYLASLPAELAAANLRHGIREVRGELGYLKLYAQKPTEAGELPTLRAVTTDSYTRVTDASIGRAVTRTLIEQGSNGHGHEWKLPKAWDGQPAGAYRSDRDSFLMLIDGGSIVEDPSASQGNGQMWRGVMIGNSEVGAKSITLESVLFRYICGNLMIWGAVMDRRFARRHVGAVDRRFAQELSDLAFRWTHQSTARDDALIRYMIDHEVASTRQGIIDQLRAWGMSAGDAAAAYDRAERTETGASPRSYWGIAQGVTRISQDAPYTGDRIELDTLAAGILQRAAKLARV